MLHALARWLRIYAEEYGTGYPDSATRYLPIVRRLRRRNLARKRILELGADAYGFGRFAKTSVVTIDRDADRLPAVAASQFRVPVLADPAHLPFRDGAFDVCVCVDAVARMASGERQQAIYELTRVLALSGRAVVAFPAGDAAEEAEERLRDFCHRAGREAPDALEQHKAHGLPGANAVFDYVHDIAGDVYRVSRRQSCSLWLWEVLWRGHVHRRSGRTRDVFQVVLCWLVPILSRWHKPPCYQTVIWIEPKDT